MRVIKRDGSIEQYNTNKIRRAFTMAYTSVGSSVPVDLGVLVERVADNLTGLETVNVDYIGETCENVLVEAGFQDEARAFLLYRDRCNRYKGLKPDPLAMSEYIHVAKYSKLLADGSRETWEQSVGRVENMHIRRYGCFKRNHRFCRRVS